jgi:hypothetical protein
MSNVMSVNLAINYVINRLFGSNWEMTGVFLRTKTKFPKFDHCLEQFHNFYTKQPGDSRNRTHLLS